MSYSINKDEQEGRATGHVQPIHVLLAWPHKDLWQNTTGHWSKRHKATKTARTEAYGAALAATGFQALKSAECTGYALWFDFRPPDMRRRDMANAQAAMKAHIDGIADALGVDDSTFRIEWPTEWGTVDTSKRGSVLVIVRPIRATVGEG